ncbi:MAG: exodeoxyribonuclease VII large subunit [Bacteroidetes bacterium]|nr:exodeoxyribonuclease VII large subunit [Bacteroidota bacterium]
MNNTPISISELTSDIRLLLEEGIGSVSVVGELSNYVNHSSGHRYFTLKDDKAQISAVLWRGKPLSFEPRNGMKLVANGKISVFPPQGKYQLDCFSLSPLGIGDLHQRFEELKQKLLTLGWFEQERKQPLPRLPLKIGVITSPTGAAIRDIISTLERRLPICEVIVRPALVQGDGAAEDIATAIRQMNRTSHNRCDVLIVGRGGGSIEDLWAFNTEIVATAIYESRIPIISAVGHEVDFTIADFVADIRAATPTAAAEIVTRITAEQFSEFFASVEIKLQRTILQMIQERKRMVNRSAESVAFRRVRESIRDYMQLIDTSELRLSQSVRRSLTQVKTRLDALELHAKSSHPFAPLERGFALLKNGDTLLKNDDSLATLTHIEIIRSREKATAQIIEVRQSV